MRSEKQYVIFTIAILMAIALAYIGPAIDDHSDEQAQAQSLEDAIKSAKEAAKREAAIRAYCGENTAYKERVDGGVVCTLKNGKVTARVMP
jgi:hypothetical protein